MVSLTAIVPATTTLLTLLGLYRGHTRLADQLSRRRSSSFERPIGRVQPRPGTPARSDASGDVLVFIDADIEIHPDAFSRIRRAFTADPGLAALFGSYDDSPEAEGVVSVFRNLLHHHVHQSAAGPATTFWGGIGAVRRDAFERVGGFDQERFAEPSVEDIELGMRLTAAGAHILLDPDVQGKHLKRWTLRR